MTICQPTVILIQPNFFWSSYTFLFHRLLMSATFLKSTRQGLRTKTEISQIITVWFRNKQILGLGLKTRCVNAAHGCIKRWHVMIFEPLSCHCCVSMLWANLAILHFFFFFLWNRAVYSLVFTGKQGRGWQSQHRDRGISLHARVQQRKVHAGVPGKCKVLIIHVWAQILSKHLVCVQFECLYTQCKK